MNFENCVGVHMRGCFISKITQCVNLITSFSYKKFGLLVWFCLDKPTFNPRNFQFLVQSSFKTIFAPPMTTFTCIPKNVRFSFASFHLYEKFVGRCPPTQRRTQMMKSRFTSFCSRIGSSLESFWTIFVGLQSLFRFKLHSLRLKIKKSRNPTYSSLRENSMF